MRKDLIPAIKLAKEVGFSRQYLHELIKKKKIEVIYKKKNNRYFLTPENFTKYLNYFLKKRQTRKRVDYDYFFSED